MAPSFISGRDGLLASQVMVLEEIYSMPPENEHEPQQGRDQSASFESFNTLGPQGTVDIDRLSHWPLMLT
jgi:hypothetical protein